jgi:hypothetical protein
MKMKTKAVLVVVSLVVLAMLGVGGVSVFMVPSDNTFETNSNVSVSPSALLSPQIQTSSPSSSNQLNPTPEGTADLEPTITISYHSVSLPCGRQSADITIKNEGYSAFSTDPHKFYITIGDKNYSYSGAFTPTFGNWMTTSILDHATYSGTLIFNTPQTTDSFTLGYDDSTYNIIYVSN